MAELTQWQRDRSAAIRYDAVFDPIHPMSTDSLDPGGVAALRARFEAQSRRAQAYYNVHRRQH